MKHILALIFTLLTTQIAFAQSMEPCFDYAVPNITKCELDKRLPKEFKNYMKTQFQSEFQNSLKLAGTIRDFNLLHPITLKIVFRNFDNGVSDGKNIGIMFAEGKPIRLDNFRETFFHELGHVLYHSYALVHSESERNYISLFESDDIPHMTSGYISIMFMDVNKPANELVADIFRVIFLKNPGVNYRNFARLPKIPLDTTSLDEHAVYNPIREYLWFNFLSKTIYDSRRNMLLLKDVMDATLFLQDEHWDHELNTVLVNGTLAPQKTARELNRRLGSLLGFNLGL